MNDSGGQSPLSERLGLVLALIMAAAAVCTAWAGYQSTKWSGVQADSYAQAANTHREATKASVQAGQQQIVDIMLFSQWLSALNAEMLVDPSARPGADYEPPEGSISGFIFHRFRPEFRPAVDAWLRTQPFVNENAPATPFVLPVYRLSADAQAEGLERAAEKMSRQAREANQHADNYVLTAVLFALVLFFASVADRSRGRRSQILLFVSAAVGLVATIAILLTFPIDI